jgi:DNA-directed RNA polymerase subunit RPC12/RpoP
VVTVIRRCGACREELGETDVVAETGPSEVYRCPSCGERNEFVRRVRSA